MSDRLHDYPRCPQCGEGEIQTGFGLAGGGYGPYQGCDRCDFFIKFQERDDGGIDPTPVDSPNPTGARMSQDNDAAAVLREALEPVMREAHRLEPNGPNETIVDSCQLWQCGDAQYTRTRLTYGDLRRATRTLEETGRE